MRCFIAVLFWLSATAIHCDSHINSLNLISLAALGSGSTEVGDHLGMLGAVALSLQLRVLIDTHLVRFAFCHLIQTESLPTAKF